MKISPHLPIDWLLFNNNLVPFLWLNRIIIKVKVLVSIDRVSKEESVTGISVDPNSGNPVSIFPNIISGSVPFEDQDVGPAPDVPPHQGVDLQLETDSEQWAPASNCADLSISLGVSR